MSASLTALAYLVAAVLFILALRGLSSPGHVASGQPLRHDRHGRGGGRHAGPSRHGRAGLRADLPRHHHRRRDRHRSSRCASR